MSFSREFSEIAKRSINKYFQEFSGSLQNTSHSKALEYRERVEKLRVNFLNYLRIYNSFLISFQPNQYYLEKVIFNFLDLENKKWNLFTNKEGIKLSNSTIFSLEEFLKLDKLNSFSFICVDEKLIDLALLEKITQKLNFFKDQYKFVYSYLLTKNLDCLKTLNFRLNSFSFISYDPEEDLSEFGTTFFLFKKEINLRAVFLGSGGTKFDHESRDIKLENLPYLLEIGTQNLTSLIVLSNYFEHLIYKTKNPSLNSIENAK